MLHLLQQYYTPRRSMQDGSQ